MAEGGIQVIDRVFDIIELLAEHEAGLGVTEIARRLDLNKTTVHRIVNGILKRIKKHFTNNNSFLRCFTRKR